MFNKLRNYIQEKEALHKKEIKDLQDRLLIHDEYKDILQSKLDATFTRYSNILKTFKKQLNDDCLKSDLFNKQISKEYNDLTRKFDLVIKHDIRIDHIENFIDTIINNNNNDDNDDEIRKTQEKLNESIQHKVSQKELDKVLLDMDKDYIVPPKNYYENIKRTTRS
jgi:hypothetical protein